MTVFIIKLIACITMFVDHVKYGIPTLSNYYTICIGRIAFPLFAFTATEAYIHTSDLKKYFKRLFIFALISQIPFMLFRTLVGEWKMLNIIFTLILGLSCITVFDKIEKKYISLPLCALIILIGELVNVDYGWYGITMVFIFFLGKKNDIVLTLLYTALVLLYFYVLKINALDYPIYFIAHMIPLIIAILYNGKKGKSLKMFFYWFYPIHMFAIWLISLI